MESYEPQQILMIPEEYIFAVCITRFAIVGHPLKHTFICKLAEEIQSSYLQTQNNYVSQPLINDS